MKPMLRFKADDGANFPDWEEKTLGELTSLFIGKSFASNLNENGRYVAMDMGSVSPDGFIIDAKLTNLDRDMLRRGDLIMPKDDIGGGLIIGKTAYIPCDDKYVCGDHVYRLRFDSEIDGLFMHYEINSSGPQRRLGRKVTGSAQLGLNSKSVSSETVSIPSLPEQRKIADLLSAVDAVIAAQQAEVDAWEQRKKGVMQKLFSQEVRFKADDGSEFPDWEEKTLGDLGVFIRGLAYDKTQTVETNGVAVMRSNNIGSDGTLDYENEVRLVSKEPSEKQLLRKNDIVICIANGSRLVGKAAKYDGGYKEPSRITVGAFCGIFRSSDPVLPWWFQSDGYQRFLYSVKQGGNGALTNINGKAIESINVMLPTSIDEQRKIADCLALMDEVIRKSKNELAKWQELKKGLLQQMFV